MAFPELSNDVPVIEVDLPDLQEALLGDPTRAERPDLFYKLLTAQVVINLQPLLFSTLPEGNLEGFVDTDTFDDLCTVTKRLPMNYYEEDEYKSKRQKEMETLSHSDLYAAYNIAANTLSEFKREHRSKRRLLQDTVARRVHNFGRLVWNAQPGMLSDPPFRWLSTLDQKFSLVEPWHFYQDAPGSDTGNPLNMYTRPPHDFIRLEGQVKIQRLTNSTCAFIEVLLTTHPDRLSEVKPLLAKHLNITVSELQEYWTRLLTFVSLVVSDPDYIQQSREHRSAWRDLQKAKAWKKAALEAMKTPIRASSVHSPDPSRSTQPSGAALSSILPETYDQRIWALAQTNGKALAKKDSNIDWCQRAIRFLSDDESDEPVKPESFYRSVKRELKDQYEFSRLTKDTFRSLVFSEAARLSVLVEAPASSGD